MAYQGLLKYQLVSDYSKSMSHERSKCLYFALVQVKHVTQNWPFFCHTGQNVKTVSGQNPPGQNLPDKIPLDKIIPRTKSPQDKIPLDKIPPVYFIFY